jgi:hypothetical protein
MRWTTSALRAAILRYAPDLSARQRRRRKNGGDRDRTDDPLLAKQVLSQLSYTPVAAKANKLAYQPAQTRTSPTPQENMVVGQGGFEPPTPRLSSVCSNQLSY